MADVIEVVVGTIGRAHGVRGEVNVTVRTDEVDRRFAVGSVLRTSTGQALTVKSAHRVSGRLIVRFEQVADRDSAEQLNGAQLVTDVPSDELPSGPEEYFDRQLVGLRVLDAAGNQAGTITEVVHGPAQDLLVVDVNGDERFVPFVSALVPVVDLAGGLVRLADVGGLLDDTAQDD